MGGGSWPRGGKKRKMRPDIARRRERQRDGESCNRTRTDARRTETTCVTPTFIAPRHLGASRYYYYFFFLQTSSARGGKGGGGGGGGAARLFSFYFFPLLSRPRAGLATV